MTSCYDYSQDEVDEPEETESKHSSAIMDQNSSSLRSSQVTIIGIFRNMRSRDILPFEKTTLPFMYFSS